MIAMIPLLAAMLLAGPQDSGTAPVPQNSAPTTAPQVSLPTHLKMTPQQLEQMRKKMEQARIAHEPIRLRAVHINELAANIRSEADARALVDAVAEELSGHRHLMWTARSIRHRVAHAEWLAVSDPSGLIPEQRVVDVWNEYVREIDAREEALITVPELHNVRDAAYAGLTHFAWKYPAAQSIWTMPSVYAVDSQGKVADGCRALEALKLIHDMHENFTTVTVARERVDKGMLTSDEIKKREQDPPVWPTMVTGLHVLPGGPQSMAASHVGVLTSYSDPIRPAMFRYQRERGMRAYNQMLRRLFDELFPKD